MENWKLLSQVEKIRERFVDEESVKIYDARIDFLVHRDFFRFTDVILNFDHEWNIHKLNALMQNVSAVNHLVIYGAGKDGTYIRRLLQHSKYKDMNILFCDRNPDKIGGVDPESGLKIISPQELNTNYRDSIVIVGSSKYAVQIMESLSYLLFPSWRILYPADNGDRHLYAEIKNQYFDYFKPANDEVFIDAGCLNGMTSYAFSEWCGGKYEKIYAFEPNENMYAVCENTIRERGVKNVDLIKKGLWDKKDKLKFLVNPNVHQGGAKISDAGNCEIEVDSIDNILNGQRASFIKMDIEGSESRALLGAARTIQTYRPRLAISMYHKIEDIVELPSIIIGLNPEYKFGMRHYASNMHETVLYAF